MAKPIRVLFAIGSMSGGGSEGQLLGLLRDLDRSQFTPLLYLAYRQGELLDEVPADVPILAFWDRHQCPRWNLPGRIHRAQVRDVEAILRKQIIDIVYDRTYLMTLMTAPATRACGVPRVSAIVSHPQHDLQRTAGRFLAVKRRLLRRAYLEASYVAAVSDGVRQATIQYYDLPEKRVITLHNTVDLERIDRMASETNPDLESGRFHIVTAGRLQQEKGQMYLLRALDQLVNKHNQARILLHVLGNGPQQQELESVVQSSGLANHVRFHGHVKNPFPMLRHAHLVCLASLYEGMPNILLEAMACRTPILSTDCPCGPREVLDDGKLGHLVPPADVEALASAINRAISDYEPWTAITAAGREHVEREYSRGTGINKLQQLFLSIRQN